MKPEEHLNIWITNDSISFSLDAHESFNAAVDTVLSSLNPSLALLGFGEALHGGEEILQLRNRLFQRLVEKHGFSAIAIESSFPRAHITNEYVLGQGPKTFEEIKDTGFGQSFGVLEANKDLVEWMKAYNADPVHTTKLRIYGLDIPSGVVGIGSPRQVLFFVLEYLSSIDGEQVKKQQEEITELIGEDAVWESPEAHMDPSKSVGLSPNATELRIRTEELIATLQSRSPELIAKTDKDTFLEALQHAKVARGLLNFHAAMAKKTTYAERLGIRDTLQAENLLYMVTREKKRGKVLAFAHNSHLKKGKAKWQLGPELITWWPAGSQVNEVLEEKYAVIGTAVGISEENGIGIPKEGTVEALLHTSGNEFLFLPTLSKKAVQNEPKTIPVRSSSQKNPTYFPITNQSFTDFDWLAFVKDVTYNRGGPPLRTWDSGKNE